MSIPQHKMAWFSLPYRKQGDDLNNCIAPTEEGKVDMNETLNTYIDLFGYVIERITTLRDYINGHPGDWHIDGNTHSILLTGPAQYIDELHEQGIVYKTEEDESSDDECSCEQCQHQGINPVDYDVIRQSYHQAIPADHPVPELDIDFELSDEDTENEEADDGEAEEAENGAENPDEAGRDGGRLPDDNLDEDRRN